MTARPWRPREQRGVLIALAVALVVFALWPGLDLVVHARLWQAGVGFAGERSGWVLWLYHWVPTLGRALAVGLFLAWTTGRWWGPLRVNRRQRQRAAVMLLAALIGQGLLIDQGLKNHWGRPRPSEVTAFGGALPYQPPLQPATLCDRNCSFVSGHAATGFGLLGLGLLAPPRTRRRWLGIGLASGAVFGLARMLQGGHFFSDIVFSFFATWLGAQAALQLWRWRVLRRRARRRGTAAASGAPG